jgi:hypothetical protein
MTRLFSLGLFVLLVVTGLRMRPGAQLGWWMYTYACHPFVFCGKSPNYRFLSVDDLRLSPDSQDLYESNIKDWLEQSEWADWLRVGRAQMIVLGSHSGWHVVPAESPSGLDIKSVSRSEAEAHICAAAYRHGARGDV